MTTSYTTFLCDTFEMDDDKVAELLRATDERLRIRTAASLPRSTTDTTVTIESLHRQVADLEARLIVADKAFSSEKEKRTQLEAALERMLMSYNVAAAHDVTKENFEDVLDSWKKKKSQVWFKKPVPAFVERALATLSVRIDEEYKTGRRSAITMKECQHLVELVRSEWEASFPPQILSSLTPDNRVTTAADKLGKGEPCEAVHYLIYIVHRLYNKAANILTGLKRQEGLASLGVESIALSERFNSKNTDRKEESTTTEPETVVGKWHDNPLGALLKYVQKARVSVLNSKMMECRRCEDAISLSVAKLIGKNKPKLSEALQYLASIIALREYARTKEWKLNSTLFRHRDSTQYRVIEAWYCLNYSNNWNKFRVSLFLGLNSLYIFFIMFHKDDVESMAAILQTMVKPGHREALVSSVSKMRAGSERKPFLSFLNDIVAVDPDYMSFYCKLYVYLVQRVAMTSVDDDDENILQHLYEDMMKHRDESKISASEKKDYVRVMIVILTSVLEEDLPLTEGPRSQLAAAAQFIGSRFYYLLNRSSLSAEESTAFWCSSPLTNYKLLDYCNEDMILFLKKEASNLGLPVYTGDDDIDDFDDLDNFHPCTTSSNDIGLVPFRTSWTMEGNEELLTVSSPKPVRGLTVHQMRDALLKKGLSSEGKKKTLQQRLVDTGLYTFQALMKRKKSTASSDGTSDDEAL